MLVLIVVLYLLSAVFPLLGISLTLYRVSLQARQYQHRTEHKRKLQRQLNAMSSPGNSELEQEKNNEWHQAELSKKDKWGKAYSYPDDGISFSGPGSEAVKSLGKLRRDAVFVGSGIVAATTASVLSLFE